MGLTLMNGKELTLTSTIILSTNKSWQLIYWPSDGQCYQIFEQGPCPDTQELAFHATNKLVSYFGKISI